MKLPKADYGKWEEVIQKAQAAYNAGITGRVSMDEVDFAVEVPLPDGAPYELVRAESAEKAAECVRALMQCSARRPLTVTVRPVPRIAPPS